MHASCAARDRDGVLLIGPAGAGKSDLLLRLIGHGFNLVADDQVELDGSEARPPDRLAGLLEVRGLGIFRLPFVAPVRVKLAVEMASPGQAGLQRLPLPSTEPRLGVPLIRVVGSGVSAPERVSLALDCVLGRAAQIAGCFAA